MANTIISANMNLPVPVVGVDPGPDWANQIDNCLTLIDAHNHSPGYGVPINPDGIDINSDLAFNGFNATALRSARFTAQTVPLSLISDVGCLYESGVDLYYNDGSGNQIRITQSGGIAGTPGSIANLTPPASVSYVSADATFVFQSDANTPGNLDAGFIILRNNVANSNGLTLEPPAAMPTDYTIILPTLPGGTSFVTMSSTGVQAASIPIAGGITGSNIAGNTITSANLTSNLNLPGKAVQENGNNVVVSNTNATNSLAIIRGTVDALGNITSGEGFTVPSVGAASYEILFNTPFADVPSVVASTSNAFSSTASPTNTTSNSQTTIITFDTNTQSLSPAAFSFIIIGQRA